MLLADEPLTLDKLDGLLVDEELTLEADEELTLEAEDGDDELRELGELLLWLLRLEKLLDDEDDIDEMLEDDGDD